MGYVYLKFAHKLKEKNKRNKYKKNKYDIDEEGITNKKVMNELTCSRENQELE